MPESGVSANNRDIKVFNNSMFKDDIINARNQQMNELQKPFFIDEEERSLINSSPTKDFNTADLFRNVRPPEGTNFSVPAHTQSPEYLENPEFVKQNEQRLSDQIKPSITHHYNVFHEDTPKDDNGTNIKNHGLKLEIKAVETDLPAAKIISNDNSMLSHVISMKQMADDMAGKTENQPEKQVRELTRNDQILQNNQGKDVIELRNSIIVPRLKLPLESMEIKQDKSENKVEKIRGVLKSVEKKGMKSDQMVKIKKSVSIPFSLNDDSLNF